MRIVVVGKGGREHALAETLGRSPSSEALWVCPGNPGMEEAGVKCAPVETPEAIEKFCVDNAVNLVVIGPEALILSDLKERLQKQRIACFAPDKEVAKLESSKVFCKEVLQKAGVKTAALQLTTQESEALQKVRAHDFSAPLVVKADGLAQGKGVWVCESLAKAEEAVKVLGTSFGYPLLLEECLQGPELSAFALCDGEDFVVLGTACDYKRISADPFSANTGGMGAFSPCDFISDQEQEEIHEIFAKTLSYLKKQNLSYQGFLFAGLMKTAKGLYILEYNVRMGDPETQALLPLLKSDLTGLIWAAVTHELKNRTCEVTNLHSVHVVGTSAGYPSADMKLGCPIQATMLKTPEARLFFAGVNRKNGVLVNSGGRVLGVTALAQTKEDARTRAYQEMQKISFEGLYLRKDIGQ